jgi:hypothetical protein
MPKSAKRFPAFAKLASAGGARSDDIMLSLMEIDHQAVIPGRAVSAKAESSGWHKARGWIPGPASSALEK